jgi:hypothetical protein
VRGRRELQVEEVVGRLQARVLRLRGRGRVPPHPSRDGGEQLRRARVGPGDKAPQRFALRPRRELHLVGEHDERERRPRGSRIRDRTPEVAAKRDEIGRNGLGVRARRRGGGAACVGHFRGRLLIAAFAAFRSAAAFAAFRSAAAFGSAAAFASAACCQIWYPGRQAGHRLRGRSARLLVALRGSVLRHSALLCFARRRSALRRSALRRRRVCRRRARRRRTSARGRTGQRARGSPVEGIPALADVSAHVGRAHRVGRAERAAAAIDPLQAARATLAAALVPLDALHEVVEARHLDDAPRGERARHAAPPRAAPAIKPIGGVGRREAERYRRIDLRRAGSLARGRRAAGVRLRVVGDVGGGDVAEGGPPLGGPERAYLRHGLPLERVLLLRAAPQLLATSPRVDIGVLEQRGNDLTWIAIEVDRGQLEAAQHGGQLDLVLVGRRRGLQYGLQGVLHVERHPHFLLCLVGGGGRCLLCCCLTAATTTCKTGSGRHDGGWKLRWRMYCCIRDAGRAPTKDAPARCFFVLEHRLGPVGLGRKGAQGRPLKREDAEEP